MTEHPETPRIVYGDRRVDPRTPDSNLRTALPAMGWNRPGRHNRYYRVFVATAIIAGLIGSYFLISEAIQFANAWLVAQPSYQIPFEQIQLVSSPPEWYLGGRQAFLESVRERAGDSTTIPVLDTKADQVKAVFVQSPWVENVVRVSFPPQGLRVELQYREPVAWVIIPGEKVAERYLLDQSAMILPLNDVDLDRPEKLGPLIVIQGRGLTAPLNPRPGAIWQPKGGIADITSEGNGRIKAAAKLASFLVRKMRSLGARRPPALEIRLIDPMDHRGLFIFNGVANDPARPLHCFFWGNEAPGEESPRNLTAEEKWTALREWSEHQPTKSLPSGDFWEFSKQGVRHVPTIPISNQRASQHPDRP